MRGDRSSEKVRGFGGIESVMKGKRCGQLLGLLGQLGSLAKEI